MWGNVFDSPEATNVWCSNTNATSSVATPTVIPPSLSSYVAIIQDGDVILDVSAGDSSRRYLVYSQVLCATSVVFRSMLGKQSKFAEAVALRESHKKDDGEPLVVTLQGDDLNTMQIVLHVMHGQHKMVPRTLTIERMASVSIICDKYGWHEGLQVMAGIWSELLKTKTKTHPADWLLISWVFGPEDIFTKVSRDLMLVDISDSGDGVLFGKQQFLLADCIPAAVSGNILPY